MSDLNAQFVREFFELHLFHVLTHWQHEGLSRVADAASLLFVENANPEVQGDVDFHLRGADVVSIPRAVVEIRAWHADRFYPSVIESSPVLAHVASSEARALAQSVLKSPEFATILVISELPSGQEHAERSKELLMKSGIDHIIEFPTILREIFSRINAYGNYAPSQTLGTMRLLKRYNFIRRQQLEFPFHLESPLAARPPTVDVQVLPDESDEND